MIKLIRNAVVGWLTHKKTRAQTPLSDFRQLRREVKPCDVILVEGRSRVSEVIKLITQSSWSHAALYIGCLQDIDDPLLRVKVEQYFSGEPDVALIIESELGMGTLVRPLSTYECEHLRICRPRDLSQQNTQGVIGYCVNMLGTGYNVRHIFDLARFLFPWFIMPRRWRSTLFGARAGESTKTVCSTMIAEAFASADFPILPLVKKVEGGRLKLYRRNPKLCTPRDFDYSPYFDIIKYPFLDFSEYANRYLKPWDGTTGLTEDERELYITPDAETG